MIHAAPFTFTQGQSPRCVEDKTSLGRKEIVTFHLQPPLKCCNFFFFFFYKSKISKEVCDGSVKSSFYCIVYRLSWRVFKSFFFFFRSLLNVSRAGSFVSVTYAVQRDDQTASVATKVTLNALYFIFNLFFIFF